MGININFQLAESLKFMEKRLIKIPRKKIILASFCFAIISWLCYFFVKDLILILFLFIFSISVYLYNILYVIMQKIEIFINNTK
jgi:hypothetical protein